MPAIIEPPRARDLMDAHKPRGWRIKQGIRVEQRTGEGTCDWDKKTIFVPLVCDDWSFMVYLHEVAHVRLHARISVEKWVPHRQEYEADMWAFERLRACGFRLSRAILRSSKRYVGEKIIEDRVRGLPIDRKIERWATAGRCAPVMRKR